MERGIQVIGRNMRQISWESALLRSIQLPVPKAIKAG
jgi:hypothetical protein